MKRSVILTAILIAAGSTPALASATIAKPAAGAKIVLHETATVLPDVNGFFTLGEISDVTGGTPELREKLNDVEVGRVPLDGYVRHLDLGDVALKLREAGVDPERDVKLGGAQDMVISTGQLAVTVKTAASVTGASLSGAPVVSTTSAQAPPDPPAIVVKKGDPVTLVLQDGALTVTASGLARDNGAVGDVIHVHRDGVMNDLMGQVVDSHTVQLEL